MDIKFLDLKALNAPYFDPFLQEMRQILEQSAFIKGESSKSFEENFAQYLNVKGCVGVGNGTDALEIALRALNLPKGSQIILPANTFKASCEAILNTGYKAVIVDCDDSYNIDPIALAQAINSHTSAILVVHLYGRICDMSQILKIARSKSLAIIEDCSQAHGARAKIEQQMLFAGGIGDIAAFSFYPSKNLGAIGDGGAITSNSTTLLERARSIANHATSQDAKPLFIGRNSRLDNLQAAFLNLKLPDLESQNTHRQNIAKLYCELLTGLDSIALPELPLLAHQSVWHLFVIRLQRELEGKRDALQDYLAQNGIQTHIHYPHNLTRIKEIKTHINTIIHPTPNANHWDENILSLPMGIHIQEKQVIYACQKIKEFCQIHSNKESKE